MDPRVVDLLGSGAPEIVAQGFEFGMVLGYTERQMVRHISPAVLYRAMLLHENSGDVEFSQSVENVLEDATDQIVDWAYAHNEPQYASALSYLSFWSGPMPSNDTFESKPDSIAGVAARRLFLSHFQLLMPALRDVLRGK